jgi:subtilisin family serine protease
MRGAICMRALSIVLCVAIGSGSASGADDAAFSSGLQKQATRIRALLQKGAPAVMSGATLCARAIADKQPAGFDPAVLTFLGLRVLYSDEAALPTGNLLPMADGSSLRVIERDARSLVLDVSDAKAFATAKQILSAQGVSGVVPECRIPLSASSSTCKSIAIPTQQQSVMPDDPDYSRLWGHALIGYRWRTAAASRPVKVAVLDSGIDCRHAELQGRFAPPPDDDAIGLNGAAGYICPPRAGYDYADMDHDAGNCDQDGVTCHRHGTAMAGTIAADGNNHLGVTGVAPNARLESYRILSSDYSIAAIPNVEMAIRDAHRNGARVLNMSVFGGELLASLCDDLAAVSAGDNGSLVTVMGKPGAPYPAMCTASVPQLLDVAGVLRHEPTGTLWIVNSSDGAGLYAPGEFLWSSNFEQPNAYEQETGSSNAVAYVSGAAAQLWGTRAFASCTAQQIRRLIDETASPVTPCGMKESIKLLNLAFLPAIADQHFASCDAAIDLVLKP